MGMSAKSTPFKHYVYCLASFHLLLVFYISSVVIFRVSNLMSSRLQPSQDPLQPIRNVSSIAPQEGQIGNH